MKKSIIFDFNGTMLLDTPLHKRAHNALLSVRIGRPLTEEDFERHIIGQDNANIFTYFLGSLTREQIYTLAEEKEAEYRRQCLLAPEIFHLTDGLVEFLDYLADAGFTMAIATGSPRSNLDFYMEQFNLSRWFSEDRIIYDDGSFRGKPFPDIYQLTMERLGVSADSCIVFEDSLPGVASAHAAGVETVIAVYGDVNTKRYDEVGGVTRVITDFRDYRTLPLA